MVRVETTVGVLDQIFRPINAISDSCKVHFDPDGIHIPGAHPMNLAAVDIDIDQSAFDAYEADGDILGIHLEKLMKTLSKVNSSDEAVLQLDAESRLLELNTGYKKFVLGLVQLDSVPEQPPIPDVSYPVSFDVSQKAFADAIDTADLFADKVTFDVSKQSDHVLVLAKGDIDKTRVKLSKDEELEKLETGDVRNSFGLSLLYDAISVIPDERNIHVELAHDRPIIISYSAVDGELDASLTIAPWKEAT